VRCSLPACSLRTEKPLWNSVPLIRALVVCQCLVFAVTAPAQAITFLSGELPSSIPASGNPYIVLAHVTITGHECVIEAGAEINFTTNTALYLQPASTRSSLVIAGTAEDPVLMRGWNGSQWIGISEQNPLEMSLVADWLILEGAADGVFLIGLPDGHNTISITNSIVSGTSASNQGIRIYDGLPSVPTGIVLDHVTVQGIANGIGIDVSSDDGAIVRSCSVQNCAWGFNLFGAVAGENLSSSGNSSGFVLTQQPGLSLTLTNASSTGNVGNGIEVSGSGEPSDLPLITEVAVAGNGANGIELLRPAIVNGCQISGNGLFDVRVQTSVVAFTTVNMRNNYWGPSTTAEMQFKGTFANINKIYDWWDNSQFSLVDFGGFIVPTSAPDDGLKAASWGEIKSRYR